MRFIFIFCSVCVVCICTYHSLHAFIEFQFSSSFFFHFHRHYALNSFINFHSTSCVSCNVYDMHQNRDKVSSLLLYFLLFLFIFYFYSFYFLFYCIICLLYNIRRYINGSKIQYSQLVQFEDLQGTRICMYIVTRFFFFFKFLLYMRVQNTRYYFLLEKIRR